MSQKIRANKPYLLKKTPFLIEKHEHILDNNLPPYGSVGVGGASLSHEEVK